MKPLSNASLEAKQCDGEEDGSRVLSLVSCLGCAQPGKYLRLGIVKILPTTKSSKKIQF